MKYGVSTIARFPWPHAPTRQSTSSSGDVRGARPGCRAPIPSKGKQQIRALFCGKRSIETQAGVIQTPVILNRHVNVNLDYGGCTQTVLFRVRDCSPGGVPYPAMARICDANLVVRRQEGKLDVCPAYARPDEATHIERFSEVGQSCIHRFPI